MKLNEKRKMKKYKFNGKEVIAVPETSLCDGCCFSNRKYTSTCEMGNEVTGPANQQTNGMPDCAKNNIIFKLAEDEK